MTILRASWRLYALAIAGAVAGGTFVAAPIIALLVAAALWAADVSALTNITAGQVLTTPASVALLVVVAGVAGVTLLLQQGAVVTITVLLAGRQPVTVRAVAARLMRGARRLIGPQLLAFLALFFVIAPLGGFSIAAFFAGGIGLPNFIVSELVKFPGATVIYVVFVITALYVNLRWLLTLPIFLLTDRSVTSAMRESWRVTRIAQLRLAGVVGCVVLGAAAVTLVMAAAALAPTRLADTHAPGLAPVVAGLSLSVMEMIAFAMLCLITALITTALVAFSLAGLPALPDAAAHPVLFDAPAEDRAKPESGALPEGGRLLARTRSRRRFAVVSWVAVGAFLIGSAAVNVALLRVVDTPRTTLHW